MNGGSGTTSSVLGTARPSRPKSSECQSDDRSRGVMQLSALLEGVDTLEIIGADTPIERVCFDSRQAGPGTLYVAVPGTQVDGHSFIGKATAAGARAIVCEHLPITLDDNTVYIRVQSASHALGLVASNFYGRPSEHLALVG